MDHFHRIATLPEKMAQVAVGANLFANGFAEPQQWSVDCKRRSWMHLESQAVYTVFTRKFRQFLPARNDLFIPLPLQHGVVFGRPTVRDPVRLSIRGRTTRTPGEATMTLTPMRSASSTVFLNVSTSVAACLGSGCTGIPMAAQRGHANSAIFKLLKPRFCFRWIGEQFIHRALPGAWIASGADLHGLEAERADFVEHGKIDGEFFVNVRIEHAD